MTIEVYVLICEYICIMYEEGVHKKMGILFRKERRNG